MSVLTAPRSPSRGRRSAALSAGAPTSNERTFRPEVQGLRALAVLMVVTYHVWFGRVSGGVDVFLLISSFLLTGQFTRKLEAGRSLELSRYWVHLFKRLLPLIVLTVLGVLGATWLWLPQTRWAGILDQGWASLFYVENWFLAAESVNYYAADHSTASPLQHFWSLSIQGQIFLLWPLIFALAAFLARTWRLKIRPLLLYLFGAVFVASLAFSIATTSTNQAFAYFDTRARLWEFALGSLVALLLPYLRLPRAARIALGWSGVAAMLACGIVLQVDQQFPGYMALWPTLSAAAVIIAGFTDSRRGADRFLSWKPLVVLGNSSYALYLFHWPILVTVLVATDRRHAGPFLGTGIILASLVLAWAATRWVDAPVRANAWANSRSRRSLLVIGLCVVLAAVPLAGWQANIRSAEQALLAGSDRNNPGAAALRPGFVDRADAGAPLVPALTGLDKQWVGLDQSCTGDFAPSDPVLGESCGQGAVDGPAAKTVVVLGDSHAEQWMGALIPVAEKNNWQLVSVLKGGCSYGAPETGDGRGADCQRFNAAATDYVLAHRPDAVFTMSTRAAPDSAAETLVPGYVEAATAFTQAGIDVVGMRDNARFTRNMAACVAQQGAGDCSFARNGNFAQTFPAAGLDQRPGVHPLDLTDRFCTDGHCPAVIGNVLVYLDDNHLTWDYAKTLAPDLEAAWFAATGWKRS